MYRKANRKAQKLSPPFLKKIESRPNVSIHFKISRVDRKTVASQMVVLSPNLISSP